MLFTSLINSPLGRVGGRPSGGGSADEMDFYLFHSFHDGCETHKAYSVGTRGFLPGVKKAGAWN
jgi:hypothetical protein